MCEHQRNEKGGKDGRTKREEVEGKDNVRKGVRKREKNRERGGRKSEGRGPKEVGREACRVMGRKQLLRGRVENNLNKTV